MESKISRYIIRVYALIINDNNEILISDEFQLNMRMTKFPGGGMEFGEGPIDCVKREAMEEFGQEIEILKHFYTTDYFQATQFYDDAQLVSIYYRAKFINPIKFKISEKSFNFEKEQNGAQSFRWININDLEPDEMTFPIDKKVVKLIKQVEV
ncbi:MAG: NUDIX domain-containing protein [Bacteroidales bacterium]|jgi:8-oxo-dGTP diphosphatase|nr:NUDIX domain-containing protein [Bacteroidales bacterium]